MRDFTSLLEDIQVFDHAFSGPLHTWSNNQEAHYIAKKLDRILINVDWLTAFPSSSVEFSSWNGSDHCAAILWMDKPFSSPPKPFRFFNFWTSHPEFLQVVADSWNRPATGCPLQLLFTKMKRLKPILKAFNLSHFGDLPARVRDKRLELEAAQLDLLYSYNPDKFLKVKMLKEDLIFLEDAEREFYKQKAKVRWTCEGDLNTSFFFSVVKSKHNKYTLRRLLKEDNTPWNPLNLLLMRWYSSLQT